MNAVRTGWKNCLPACLKSRGLVVALLVAMTVSIGGSRATALTIFPTFDDSITSDPRAGDIQTTIAAMCFEYQNRIADPGLVNITFTNMPSGLGESFFGGSTGSNYAYSNYVAALYSHATSLIDLDVINDLPITNKNPVNQATQIYLQNALARTLGLTTFAPASDNTIGLNIASFRIAESDGYGFDFFGCLCFTKYSLCPVICHEIDEVLGMHSALDGKTNGNPAPTDFISTEDLWRYDANGVRSFTLDVNAVSYFTLPGYGTLERFNQKDGGDFHDWFGDGIARVQNATGITDTDPRLGDEMVILDIIGYKTLPNPVWCDLTESSGGNGAYFSAYNSDTTAANNITGGGTIMFKKTPTLHHTRLDTSLYGKQLRLVSFEGTRITR